MTDPYAVPPPGAAVPAAAPLPAGAPVPAGYGPPGGYPAAPARNGFGTTALVLGILAIVTSITVVGGVLLGVLAVIFGLLGRGRARRGEATNGGLALAGVITGVIGILLAGALIAFGASILNSKAGKNLQSCLRDAGADTTAQQACQKQFQQQYGG